MLNVSNCTVTCADDFPFSKIEHARVTQNGGRATILGQRPGETKYTQVERITDVQVIENTDGWTLQGTSLTLLREVGLAKSDAAITVHVVGKQGCTTC